MPLTALEHELRQRARDRIRDGRLPGEIPSRCWGGHGSNAPCSLCDEVIAPGEVEYEIESVEGGLHRIHRFHFLCHAAWQLECARQEYLSRSGHFGS
jgi:hypothetical protein